jgi:hypothetical protein
MAVTDVVLTIPSFYFDTDSFDNPMTVSKSFRMKYSLTAIFYQQVIVETSINTAVAYDSYINTISPTNYEYMRVEDFYTKVLAPESSGIIEFKVALSLNTLKIERKVYSFYEILGQIGGVMAILLPSGALLSGLFSNKIYSMKMLSLLYHVDKDNQDQESKTTRVKVFGTATIKQKVPDNVS